MWPTPDKVIQSKHSGWYLVQVSIKWSQFHVWLTRFQSYCTVPSIMCPTTIWSSETRLFWSIKHLQLLGYWGVHQWPSTTSQKIQQITGTEHMDFSFVHKQPVLLPVSCICSFCQRQETNRTKTVTPEPLRHPPEESLNMKKIRIERLHLPTTKCWHSPSSPPCITPHSPPSSLVKLSPSSPFWSSQTKWQNWWLQGPNLPHSLSAAQLLFSLR